MNFEQARSNMVLNQLRANRIKNSSLIEKIDPIIAKQYAFESFKNKLR